MGEEETERGQEVLERGGQIFVSSPSQFERACGEQVMHVKGT